MLKFNANDPFPIQRKGNRIFQQIVCDRCGGIDDRSAVSGPASPEALVRHWRVKSWDVDIKKKYSVCPMCVRKEIEARRSEKEQRKMEKAANIIDIPPSQSSALAKKIMSDLLFDHYDVSAQDYRDGWDDARIAKESGLSETFVTQRRASDYGPVKPKKPAAIKQANTALANSQSILRDLASRAHAMETIASQALIIVEAALAAIVLENTSKKP